MISSIKALSWEVVKKNQISLLIILVLFPATWMVIKTIMMSMPAYADLHYNRFGNMLLLNATLYLCIILSYVNPSAHGVSGGFPQHIFRLPLTTRFIALVPILLSSVIVSIFVLCWIYFIAGYSYTISQQVIIAAAVSTLLIWFQAIIWGFVNAAAQKSMILLIVLISLGVILQSILIEPIELSLIGYSMGLIALVFMMASGYVVAYFAVSRARYSQPDLHIPVADFFIFLLSKIYLNKTINTFKSPIEAQDWYEWKRHGWLMPAIILLISAPFVLVASTNKPNVEFVFIFFSIGPAYLTALMGGEYASSGSTAGKRDITSFIGTRPLSNFELAMSKLRLVGKSLSLSIVIIIVTLTMATLLIKDKVILLQIEQLLISSQGSLGALIVVFLFFALEFSLCWAIASISVSLMLTANKKGQWILSGAIVIFILFLIDVGQKIYESEEYRQSLIDSAHYIIILPTLFISAVTFYFMLKFKKIESFIKLKYSSTVITTILAICLLLLWQVAFPFTVLWAISWLFVDVALLSFIPFVGAPLAININRIR